MKFYEQFFDKKVIIETLKSGATAASYAGTLISIQSNFLEINAFGYPKNIFINSNHIVTIREA